jgi:large subunit ribosomal protein L3
MSQILARKVGMTQVFDGERNLVPVTVLQAGPVTVVQKKTKEKDGYDALQVGFLPTKESRIRKPLLGHFKKANVKPFKVLREIRLENMAEVKPGQELKVSDLFKVGDFLDVSGISKGKGFQGAMKRHNFGGGPDSHGSMSHRRPASGGETNAQRRLRGSRGPGHMGAERVTVQGLEVVGIEPEKDLILVKGGVPGAVDGLLFLKTSVKSEKKIHKRETRKAAKQQQETGKEKTKAKGSAKK